MGARSRPLILSKKYLVSKSIHPQQVRELLQYVPNFSRKLFAFDVPWEELTDQAKADFMLDVSALQRIGVKMLISVNLASSLDVIDWAIDFDLKLENDIQMNPQGAEGVIERGQIALVPRDATDLGAGLQNFTAKLSVEKVIIIISDSRRQLLKGGESISSEEWRVSKPGYASFFQPVSDLLSAGVRRVHLLDAFQQSAILSELFSNEGSGLMVYSDSYKQIRKISSEDIPELLTLIGKSVRTSHLVPREYEDILQKIEDYYVYQIDENIVGCISLHSYDADWAEIACLFVKYGHQGRGYGEDLVNYVQQVAKKGKKQHIFALTTAASSFFEERMKFDEVSVETIPSERLKQLKESGRASHAFYKQIC